MQTLNHDNNPQYSTIASSIYTRLFVLAIVGTLIVLASPAMAQAQGAYNQQPEGAPEETSPYDGGAYNVPEGEGENASPEAREFAEQMEPDQTENGEAQDDAAEPLISLD